MLSRLVFLFLILIALGAGFDNALATDMHAMFEKRCGACHDHAGELARQSLTLRGSKLVGRESGARVEGFLLTHRGGVSAGEARDLAAMFRRQVDAAGRFQVQCAICHVRAVDLARHDLIFEGGRLRGRYSGRDIGEFLVGHGRLDRQGASFFNDHLGWVLKTLR